MQASTHHSAGEERGHQGQQQMQALHALLCVQARSVAEEEGGRAVLTAVPALSETTPCDPVVECLPRTAQAPPALKIPPQAVCMLLCVSYLFA